MSISVKIPQQLYKQAAEFAAAQHVSVDEVFVAAFEERLAALDRLRRRAARGDRDRFLAILAKAPDVEPEAYDRV